jgi:hypothetical protein
VRIKRIVVGTLIAAEKDAFEADIAFLANQLANEFNAGLSLVLLPQFSNRPYSRCQSVGAIVHGGFKMAAKTQAERDRDHRIWRRRVAGESISEIALGVNARYDHVVMVIASYKRAYKRQTGVNPHPSVPGRRTSMER